MITNSLIIFCVIICGCIILFGGDFIKYFRTKKDERSFEKEAAVILNNILVADQKAMDDRYYEHYKKVMLEYHKSCFEADYKKTIEFIKDNPDDIITKTQQHINKVSFEEEHRLTWGTYEKHYKYYLDKFEKSKADEKSKMTIFQFIIYFIFRQDCHNLLVHMDIPVPFLTAEPYVVYCEETTKYRGNSADKLKKEFESFFNNEIDNMCA